MQRSSIIATVVAAGGILIAGSVASVAVINAASSSQPGSETIQLVAAGSASTPTPEATDSVSAERSAAAAEPPTMDASELPELPEVEQPAAQSAAVEVAPATPAKPASKASATKGADDDAQRSDSAEPVNTVSENQARSIVMEKGDGVSIVSSSKESHEGYSTWAVRITRSNGEVLTGYVDRASGVVVDWTVNQKAQAPQPTSSASDDDDDATEAGDDSGDDSGDSSGSGSGEEDDGDDD